MQKSSGAGDRRGSGREIPRAGNPRPSCLQRFCKRNRGTVSTHACGRLGAERDLDGSMMNPMDAGAGNAFFPKKESARRVAARRCAARSGDSAPPSRAASADPRRAGAAGAGCFCACDAGGASMRLHVGFMMDPTADRGPDRVPPRSGCRRTAVRRPPLPPDGKFPMRPKRVRRACRSMGSGAGEGRPAGPADRMEGGGDRPDAIVRGSGCPCACGARVTHAICKRHRSHIPTQPIQRSHIPTQNMLLQNMPMQILRRP